jgi:hypothetical protein
VRTTGSASAVLVASDADAATQVARQLGRGSYGFVWTQLNDLANFFFDRCVCVCVWVRVRVCVGALVTSRCCGQHAVGVGE